MRSFWRQFLEKALKVWTMRTCFHQMLSYNNYYVHAVQLITHSTDDFIWLQYHMKERERKEISLHKVKKISLQVQAHNVCVCVCVCGLIFTNNTIRSVFSVRLYRI